jgi:hypothetical protein
LCPFGFGQRGWVNASQFAPVISGNGLSIYKNPTNGQKTLVVVFSAMNSMNNVQNALKIGISSASGAPVYNSASAKLFLNRIAMDGARFLNPDRPGDLYISNFQFNANFIAFSNQNDAKVGVQVIQFTPDQLDASFVVDPSTALTTVKYCPPSAGPLVSLDDVKNNRATSLRDMTIKVYNAVDCSPAASVDRTITIPHTRNACNRYNENATSSRFFKIRCNAGEQYNSIRAANKYLFKDYASESECMSDGVNPIGDGLSLLSVGRRVLVCFLYHIIAYILLQSKLLVTNYLFLADAAASRCLVVLVPSRCTTPQLAPTLTPILTRSAFSLTLRAKLPPSTPPPSWTALQLALWPHSNIPVCLYQPQQAYLLEQGTSMYMASVLSCFGRKMAIAKE